MRVFRDTFRTKSGTRKKCAGWTAEFSDHQDRTRRVGAFKDKRASEELGRKLEQLAALRAAGMQPDAILTQWLEGLSAKMRGRLVKIGLLDGRAVATASDWYCRGWVRSSATLPTIASSVS